MKTRFVLSIAEGPGLCLGFRLGLCLFLGLSLGAELISSCAPPKTPDSSSLGQISTSFLHTEPGNPYLPLWEHTPDGEPKVFEDPDNPGQYRVYVYYSHDTKNGSYCGVDTRCWSTPVDDLSSWRDEGAVFSHFADGGWDSQFAPDIAEVVHKDGSKEYYLYPNDQSAHRNSLVARSKRPAGPFTPVNLDNEGITQLEGNIIGFDPGVFVDYITDSNDPDFSIGYRVYAYWGIIQASFAQLDQNTMWSVRPGTQVAFNFNPSCILNTGTSSNNFLRMMSKRLGISGKTPNASDFPYIYPDQTPCDFSFFEASSIRKAGNKYILIWSGYSGPEYGLPLYNSTLRYAYSDSPTGPWKSGGVLVDARGPVPSRDGGTLEGSFFGDNTHGSIVQIDGRWYVFYHRAPGYGHQFARQAMVAPINIECDETPVSRGGKVVITGYDYMAPDHKYLVKGADGTTYSGAEVTSEGFWIYGLPPYHYYSAGYACHASNDHSLQLSYDIWDNSMIASGVCNGDVLGFKYFGFGGLDRDTGGLQAFEGTAKGNGTSFSLFLSPISDKAFEINVMMDGPWDGGVWRGRKIAEISVPAGAKKTVTEFKADISSTVDGIGGKHAIYLVAKGGKEKLCDIIGMGFSSAKHPLSRSVPPQISIKVGGKPLEIPALPTFCNNENGIVDYNVYDIGCTLPDETMNVPRVRASSDSRDIKISIFQASSVNKPAIVKFSYKGIDKYYRINFI